MDLMRSWLLAAAVYLGLNYLFVFIIGDRGPVDWLYLLCPVVAGIAASAYHAEYGAGGWQRHLWAVLSVPVAFELYARVVRDFPQSGQEWGSAAEAVGFAVVAAGVGLGIVMLTRRMVTAGGLRKATAR